VATTTVGVILAGVAGAGAAYALTYAIYLVVVWVAARPIVRMPITADVLAGLALALALGALQLVRSAIPPLVTGGVLLAAAALAIGLGWRTIQSQRVARLVVPPPPPRLLA
jgi:hypothetical protein